MGFKKLWSKVARSLAIHRIVRLDYPFASQAASVKDGYATCEVLDRCCLRCFLGGILHGVNWPLLLVCLHAAERIIAMAEENGCTMSSQATISLIDHISFAIERQNNGLALPNLLLHETKLLYRKEYELGRRSLAMIRDCCGVTLPEDEAGYIAMHIISISVDQNAAYDVLKFVKAALDIIKQTYGIALDHESIDAMRLITHLKFLAQRMFQNHSWEDEGMENMYEMLLDRHPQNRLCLERLDGYCQNAFGYTLNLQEKFYLLVHLTKIF